MFIVLAEDRDNLQVYLKESNIESLIYYSKPLHKHLAYQKSFTEPQDLTKSENLAKKVLALPVHQHLNENQILYVCEKIKEFYKL